MCSVRRGIVQCLQREIQSRIIDCAYVSCAMRYAGDVGAAMSRSISCTTICAWATP